MKLSRRSTFLWKLFNTHFNWQRSKNIKLSPKLAIHCSLVAYHELSCSISVKILSRLVLSFLGICGKTCFFFSIYRHVSFGWPYMCVDIIQLEKCRSSGNVNQFVRSYYLYLKHYKVFLPLQSLATLTPGIIQPPHSCFTVQNQVILISVLFFTLSFFSYTEVI